MVLSTANKYKKIRVGIVVVRFSTKGKKTKTRAFDITFNPFEFRTMTVY